jgi:hypothetical protein
LSRFSVTNYFFFKERPHFGKFLATLLLLLSLLLLLFPTFLASLLLLESLLLPTSLLLLSSLIKDFGLSDYRKNVFMFAHFMAAGSEMLLIRIHTGNQTGSETLQAGYEFQAIQLKFLR